MNPANTGFPQIARFDSVARLPKVFGVHIGWIVALILVALVQVYLTKTEHGYEISVVGESMDTAKYAGMNTKKKSCCAACSFRAHSAELPGCFRFRGQTIRWWKQWRAEWALRLSQWPGWHGSTLPWLWSVAFLFSILEKGSNSIQTVFNISNAAAQVLMGIILFFMLGCEFFLQYRMIWRRKEHHNG